MKWSGIYAITSPSGGQYVGSAVNIRARWKVHRRQLNGGIHHCKPLQRAWRKYGGRKHFTFRILLICDKHQLLFYEQMILDTFNPAYNVCRTAGSNLGVKFGPHSPEQKARISALHKGRKRPPETGRRISAALQLMWKARFEANPKKKKPTREDGWRSSSEKQKGKPRWSNADRARISLSLIGNTRSLGRRLSDEHKAKISASQKGKPGKRPSAETRAKMSSAKIGRTIPPDVRAKMSDSMRRYRAAERLSWVLECL